MEHAMSDSGLAESETQRAAVDSTWVARLWRQAEYSGLTPIAGLDALHARHHQLTPDLRLAQLLLMRADEPVRDDAESPMPLVQPLAASPSESAAKTPAMRTPPPHRSMPASTQGGQVTSQAVIQRKAIEGVQTRSAPHASALPLVRPKSALPAKGGRRLPGPPPVEPLRDGDDVSDRSTAHPARSQTAVGVLPLVQPQPLTLVRTASSLRSTSVLWEALDRSRSSAKPVPSVEDLPLPSNEQRNKMPLVQAAAASPVPQMPMPLVKPRMQAASSAGQQHAFAASARASTSSPAVPQIAAMPMGTSQTGDVGVRTPSAAQRALHRQSGLAQTWPEQVRTEQSPSSDIDTIAARVERRFLRRLEVERERRGLNS